ncbi:TDP-N-acetylfucosamine:lipid II N-acetylfucosaminyltransferase [Lentisalinibacter salinarum]|uniref:TDP-N-acetylfucosamine:lipid II N-acetylfucosaminyltransferase n=1 Tax=Lentisalinibacter salinarum TaxID=2992239 RepID=UPI003864F6C1
MNVLHIFSNDRFVSVIDDVFDRLSGVANRYRLIYPRPDHAMPPRSGLGQEVGYRYLLSSEKQDDFKWADCLLVHGLSVASAPLVLGSRRGLVKVWSGWGADYYRLFPAGLDSVYGAKTRELVAELDGRRSFAFLRAARRAIEEQFLLAPAARRFHIFSAPVPQDYLALRAAFGDRAPPNYAQINYVTAEDSFAAQAEAPTSDDILVGNSASPTNNHLEVLEILANLQLGHRRVVVPLSYGRSDYREAIVAAGERLLGENFIPIVKYMPLEHYRALLGRCSIAIMNHYRQQAVGNIGALIYSGAKVFMDQRSTVYQFLRERGAAVFTIEQIQREGIARAFEPLKASQVATNHKVLEEFWSRKKVFENAELLIDAIRRQLG